MVVEEMTSWIDIPADSDFSLRNIPFSIFSAPPGKSRPRCCTAIGLQVVDLSILSDAGLFDSCVGFSPRVFNNETLNDFLSFPRPVWVAVRNRLIDLFTDGGSDDLRSNLALQDAAFHDVDDIHLHLPVSVGDYTDFYSSREHATNVGTMFRGKDNALQPNWLHLPVGYHGRSSTVFASGTPVRRPCGQLQKNPSDPTQGSVFGPCKNLDFELEMAFFVGGPPNDPGQRLEIGEAYNRIFGFCLMNDWSARDIQAWEYVPLGPFTAKNFGTTISPWIVTTMALEEFHCTTSAIEQTQPEPLPYLRDPNYGSFDISLVVAIQAESMNQPETVCQSNFRNLYWNASQQLVHHSVTGCVMRPGDLLGSGTISGSSDSSFGSLLELCWKGTRDVPLGQSGEVRKFLKDGDTVVMKGWCEKEGYGRVGFGVCKGKVLPAQLPGQVVEPPDPPHPVETERYQRFKLYGFWKSSSTWRVRIALRAKSIVYETMAVNLKEHEQKSQEHMERNPMGQVPVLECIDILTNKTIRLSQSIAIIEFLEEIVPNSPSLFPRDTVNRAKAREMVEVINSGTQPLQNLPLMRRLEHESEGKVCGTKFAAEMIEKGLGALETLVVRHRKDELGTSGGPYCLGGFAPSVVDICLVPQLYNARLFGVNLSEVCPTLVTIEAACTSHPWFEGAHPSVQPDAEH